MKSGEPTYFLQAFFTGRVQGVGFRYSTSQVAKEYEVTGYVRNLVDGRVELELEGSEVECQRCLRTLQEDMDSYIRKTEVSSGQRDKKFNTFSIG